MIEPSQAQNFFPRGLRQPAGSFRFSVDALLLGAFAAHLTALRLPATCQRLPAIHLRLPATCQCLPAIYQADTQQNIPQPAQNHSLLDLGCGCGVVGFAFMLRCRQLKISPPCFDVLGLDLQPELILAARENAALLGLAEHYQAMEMDLRQLQSAKNLPELLIEQLTQQQIKQPAKTAGESLSQKRSHGFELITANPPYRKPGTGRLPKSQARRLALFGDTETLDAFTRVAALMLAPGGLFCLTFTTAREKELEVSLRAHELKPIVRLEICGKENEAPELLLLAASHQNNTHETMLPNLDSITPLPRRLCLHYGQNKNYALTQEGISFCPFLACNAHPQADTGRNPPSFTTP